MIPGLLPLLFIILPFTAFAQSDEDCMMCHTPHGSVADNLLIANEPTLCLNCHAMHFHATIEGWDGDFGTPQAPERAGTSTPDGWKQGMLVNPHWRGRLC